MKNIMTLVAVLLILCVSTTAFAEATAPFWINSNVIGNVDADMEVSPREDFHLYVNRDWLAKAQLPEGEAQVSSFSVASKTVRQQVLTLLNSQTQASHDGQLAQEYYQAFMDMDTRNALGMSPVMPMIEAIQSIQTLDELTQYCLREDQLSNSLFGMAMLSDFMDSSRYAMYIAGSAYSLSDADEYKNMTSSGERTKQALTPLLEKLLVRVGYSQAEATEVVERMYALEGQIASAAKGSSAAKQADYITSIYNPFTVAELDELSPVFPITKLLKNYIDAGIDRFILMDKGWLAKMNEVFVPENLDGFKAMLLCSTLRSATPYLDQACIDLMDEMASVMYGTQIHTVLEDTAYSLCSSALGMAVGRMYSENYVTPEVKQEVENIITEVVAVYKNRLENNTWLREETRQKAIEKLDNLRIRVAYPDDWSKYDMSDIVFPENATLLDKQLAINLHDYRAQMQRSLKPVDKDYWNFTPQTVNAFYYSTDNSINILAGILAGGFYDADDSRETILGGIGTVIAHEITHGFDTIGSQYDKDGNLASWWNDEDHAAFTQRTDKVSAYFSTIEVLPGKYCDGQLTIAETVADLGAVSCILELARGIDGFDYDAFFTAYAKIWALQEPLELQDSMLLSDSHAPNYLRTNVTLQQFQELYDTYGIVEGDGMYLAPERRLSVW